MPISTASALIATLGVISTLLGVAVAILSTALLRRQTESGEVSVQLTERDISLTAYSNAIQGLLGLKESFAEMPEFFKEQIRLGGNEEAIPESMRATPETFLLFAGGMWRFSYVFSIMSRWESLGLTPNERDGLKDEIVLWMHGLPGFFEVYKTHTSKLRAHNREFLDFLEQEVFNEAYVNRQKEAASTPEITSPQP